MGESHNWYVRRGKHIRGPFPAGLVSRHILLGRIRESDEVSNDQAAGWRPVKDVPDLVPEVMREAMANPDDPEAQEHLAMARRWADERNQAAPPPTGVERRSDADGTGGKHSAGASRPRLTQVSPLAYLVVVALLASVVAIPFLLPSRSGVSEPQCDAPPAPGVNWRSCVLEGEDFANADLSGATLRNATLTGTVLRAADLSGADMAYVNLSLAQMRGASLEGVNLLGANLRRADLSYADLRNADLSYALLNNVKLEGADLTGARLDNAEWADGVICAPGSTGECIRQGQ